MMGKVEGFVDGARREACGCGGRLWAAMVAVEALGVDWEYGRSMRSGGGILTPISGEAPASHLS